MTDNNLPIANTQYEGKNKAMSISAESSSGRRGRRAWRVEVAKVGVIEQLPWAQPVYTDPPTEPLDEDGLEAVHDAATVSYTHLTLPTTPYV